MFSVPLLYSPRIALWDARMLYNWGVAIFSLAPFTIRPSRSAWVRRTVLRHSTPALGGDLLLAVEAMTPVVVVVC